MPRAAHKALLICFVLMGCSSAARAHEGSLGNEAMWEVCEGRKINDDCSFQNVDHDVFRGTCQAMSNAMACVRNQPIERAASSSHTHVVASAPRPAPSDNLGSWWPWLAAGGVCLVVGLAFYKTRRRADA